MYCVRKITPAGLSQPFRTFDSVEEGKRWIITEAIECRTNGYRVLIGEDNLSLDIGDVKYVVGKV
jgi:hypothetical protein